METKKIPIPLKKIKNSLRFTPKSLLSEILITMTGSRDMEILHNLFKIMKSGVYLIVGESQIHPYFHLFPEMKRNAFTRFGGE